MKQCRPAYFDRTTQIKNFIWKNLDNREGQKESTPVDEYHLLGLGKGIRF